MTTVKVNASKSYDVVIGENLLDKVDDYIKNIATSQKIAIITDDKVDKLYYNQVVSSLNDYQISKFVFKNGEKSKNSNTYVEILEFLAEQHITRSDLIIALGGGVVGDMAGFAAATFLRGIKFIQIPTTLLAAVDSSVGGKTAIDLKAGKNLAGAFYQPSLVLCDYSTLKTLEKEIFADGCAEVIKYAIIGDKKLFSHLTDNGLDFDLEYVISTCVQMKADIVNKDEFDKGERQKLNLGHTVGHSVELCSKFKISHGSAVAIGMVIVANACYKLGICDEICLNQIKDIINKFTLPESTQYSYEELFEVALSDKKRTGNTVNLIVPKCVGNCIIKPVTIEELKDFIKLGVN